uniref:Uncharacterized protein n=1 Tax=Strongyloides venezuelensis TaxID=75913 RepID=A0A0K0FP84_STRVS
MPKIDERISLILEVTKTLGYDISELSVKKRETVVDLLKEVFSDDPDKLIRNVKIRLEQITVLLVEENQKKVSTESNMSRENHDMELYKALPTFDGESSISDYLKKFENAMRYAEYEMVNKEGTNAPDLHRTTPIRTLSYEKPIF